MSPSVRSTDEAERSSCDDVLEGQERGACDDATDSLMKFITPNDYDITSDKAPLVSNKNQDGRILFEQDHDEAEDSRLVKQGSSETVVKVTDQNMFAYTSEEDQWTKQGSFDTVIDMRSSNVSEKSETTSSDTVVEVNRRTDDAESDVSCCEQRKENYVSFDFSRNIESTSEFQEGNMVPNNSYVTIINGDGIAREVRLLLPFTDRRNSKMTFVKTSNKNTMDIIVHKNNSCEKTPQLLSSSIMLDAHAVKRPLRIKIALWLVVFLILILVGVTIAATVKIAYGVTSDSEHSNADSTLSGYFSNITDDYVTIATKTAG